MDKVTSVQMAELCEAVKPVPEMHLVARKLCAELEALRQDATNAPEDREQLRVRDKFLSKVHTLSGQLDALKYVHQHIGQKLEGAAATQPPGYRAALSDLLVFVEAAQAHATAGKSMTHAVDSGKDGSCGT